MTMADRTAVMDHGVLQQVGTRLEIYNNPATSSSPGSSARRR
jgi:multiple sugar transport system ATP-binding protein